MCNQFIQPSHSNLYIRCIHKKSMPMLILCQPTHKQLWGWKQGNPLQLEHESKNGAGYKIKNVYQINFSLRFVISLTISRKILEEIFFSRYIDNLRSCNPIRYKCVSLLLKYLCSDMRQKPAKYDYNYPFSLTHMTKKQLCSWQV